MKQIDDLRIQRVRNGWTVDEYQPGSCTRPVPWVFETDAALLAGLCDLIAGREVGKPEIPSSTIEP